MRGIHVPVACVLDYEMAAPDAIVSAYLRSIERSVMRARFEHEISDEDWEIASSVSDIEPDPNRWAWEQVENDIYSDPDRAWVTLCSVFRQSLTEEVLAVISAGHLEDFLVENGRHYLPRIRPEASSNLLLARALSGVWLEDAELRCQLRPLLRGPFLPAYSPIVWDTGAS